MRLKDFVVLLTTQIHCLFISTQQLVGRGSVNENAAVCLKVFSVARKAATPTLTELLRLSVRSPVCLAKQDQRPALVTERGPAGRKCNSKWSY